MFLPGLDKYLELLNITKRWPKKCESSVFFSDRKVGPTGGWNNKRLWIADWACIYYLCTYSYGLQIADDEEDDGGGVWSETFPLGDHPTDLPTDLFADSDQVPLQPKARGGTRLQVGAVLNCRDRRDRVPWVFPKIVGFPPKSSILIGVSIINHPFWGTVPLFWETPTLKINGYWKMHRSFLLK